MPKLSTKTLDERLAEYVNFLGPAHPVHGRCWVWLGSKTRGYGIVHLPKKNKIRAHRLSWILHYGELGVVAKVLHKCDNPACVNPLHLFVGTDGDNVRDCSAKGRISRGEGRPTSKLTESDVISIRNRYVKGCLYNGARQLAREYKVSQPAIQHIIARKNWAYL